VIIQPPGHKRIDKLVYLCGDHKVDMLEVGVSEVNIKESGNAEVDPNNVGEDTECSSMDELESSVSEEKLGMEAALGVEKKEGAKECKNVEVDNSEDGFMSQSLLKRS
jgi:hypothetical protein